MLVGDKAKLGNEWYPRVVRQIEGIMIGEWHQHQPSHRVQVRGIRRLKHDKTLVPLVGEGRSAVAENRGIDNVTRNETMERVRAILDDPELGPGEFTDQEWATAGEQMEAIREEVRAHPRAAAAEAQGFAEISRRVRTLKAIRKARGLTQQQLSDQLQISQGEVSRIERRGNLHLATLVRFIEATGGKLRITAVFDDQEMEVGVGDLLHAEPAP